MSDMKSDGLANEKVLKAPVEAPKMSTVSPLAPSPDQARHWAKKYRTEIAASSSSVLSTFVAVNTALSRSRA